MIKLAMKYGSYGWTTLNSRKTIISGCRDIGDKKMADIGYNFAICSSYTLNSVVSHQKQ